MTTKYTAEDFARAEFARHKNRGLAARVDSEGTYPWNLDYDWASDAEMAADPGWRIVRDAESMTAREHLDAAWEKAHETDAIPAGAGCITKWGDGSFSADPAGFTRDRLAKFLGTERRLLDPPAPQRPEGAEEIERLLTEGLGDFSPPATPEAIADLLAVRGLRAARRDEEKRDG